MECRHLGTNGLKVNEIAYGHRADGYADKAAETVLGMPLSGLPRDSYELCSKVFWPTGDGVNDLLRKIDAALGHVVVTDPALTRSPAERP